MKIILKKKYNSPSRFIRAYDLLLALYQKFHEIELDDTVILSLVHN